MKKYSRLRFIAVMLTLLMIITGCADEKSELQKKPLGIFIGCDFENIPEDIATYETVILDAQYFSADNISELKEQGCRIYSYLNVGSIENYRDYYDRFKKSRLAEYENWEDEYWIDMSDTEWQDYVSGTIAAKLIDKGIDGFFIDNADVYYMYKSDAVYEGLNNVMKKLGESKLPITINGGDEYVKRLIDDGKAQLINGVNQECVFSSIEDYSENLFSRNDNNTTAYYTEYLKICKSAGLDVSLTEYTRDDGLAAEIREYCDKHGYIYYISDSVELDG